VCRSATLYTTHTVHALSVLNLNTQVLVGQPPQVIVTLSGGQGGTEADGAHQRENPMDSWQVTEAAAAAGLVLVSICASSSQRIC
jgi:hypothetical protein